jgi:hypothetical protein
LIELTDMSDIAPPTSGRLGFRPRARIIRTIGDRLISGPESAVIELVKNSHDADASWVRVKFFPPFRDGAGTIVVSDDGHGMTLDDIEEKWMEPATTDKVERGKTNRGRKMLGSKGIGRFAAAKLGRWLTLDSTAVLRGDEAKLQRTIVPGIDWDLFDTEKYLSDVTFSFDTSTPAEVPGTVLRISELRDAWSIGKLKTLYQELRRMISPLEVAEESDFRIYLDLSECALENSGFDGVAIVHEELLEDEWKQLGGHERFLVRPFPLLRSCDYEVEGEFDEYGTFIGSLTIHRAGLEPQKLRHEIVSHDDETTCGTVLVHLCTSS